MTTTPAEVVRTRLLAIPEVTALVGQRVYTLMFPQNFTGTGIRVQRISERDTEHLRGVGGQWTARVQVDCVAPSVSQAFAIDRAAYGDGSGAALAGYRGAVGTTFVQAIRSDTVREDFEAAETQLVRVMRDYFVTFIEEH